MDYSMGSLPIDDCSLISFFKYEAYRANLFLIRLLIITPDCVLEVHRSFESHVQRTLGFLRTSQLGARGMGDQEGPLKRH